MADTTKKKTTRRPASKKSATTAGTRTTTTARPKAGARKSSTNRTKASSQKTTTSRSKTGGRKPAAAAPKAGARKSTARAKTESPQPLEQQFGSLLEGISDLTSNALKFASKTRERAAKAKEMASGNKRKEPGKTPSAVQLRQMADAGDSLRDLREVAGLTLADITAALKVKDKSFLEAVEDGKEALSIEMIMRLASLYARNDPIPFVVKYIRTYKPRLWEVLEGWGLDGLPLKIERERRFINIYKRRDAARQLSSEGYEKVLAFTQEAFELALHFIAELEEVENEVNHEFDDVQDNDTAEDKE
jgi:transcriptional regulator with XRE-family HTH domain